MPSQVSSAYLESPVAVGYSVSWVFIESPTVTIATDKLFISFCYLDSGTGVTGNPFSLGSVSFTQTTSASFSSGVNAIVPNTGTEKIFVSWTNVISPISPPPIYDFPVEQGVDFTSTITNNFAATLTANTDSGTTVPFFLGSLSFSSSISNSISGSLSRRLTQSRTKITYG